MLINGNSAIRFREYETACANLKAIWEQLSTEDGRAFVLDRLFISARVQVAADEGDTRAVEAVGKAMSAVIKADAPQYLAGLIEKAQADVLAASNALRDALADDLLAKHMKKPGAKK